MPALGDEGMINVTSEKNEDFKRFDGSRDRPMGHGFSLGRSDFFIERTWSSSQGFHVGPDWNGWNHDVGLCDCSDFWRLKHSLVILIDSVQSGTSLKKTFRIERHLHIRTGWTRDFGDLFWLIFRKEIIDGWL